MAATVPASAKAIVQQVLDEYGLGSLIGWAWGVYTGAGGGQTGMSAISTEIVNTPEFKTMYPEYATLAKEGRAMSVQQIRDYRTQAIQIMHAAGLPSGFYDQPSDLSKFILGNVSVSELQQRVQFAQQATVAADPLVTQQLKGLFGLDQGHLAAYFLDPKTAEPILAQRFTAAQIAAEADRTKAAQLNATQALGLAAEGVTQSQAQQGFQQLGTERGLFQAQSTGEQTIGLDTQLAAQFGGDTNAQLAFQQRQAQRKAEFNQNTGFGVGQQGVTALAPTKQTA